MLEVHNSAKRLTPAHIGLKAWLPSNTKKPTLCHIEKKISDKQGDYNITTKALGQGDIALKEDPFIRLLSHSLHKSNCSYCFKAVKNARVDCRAKHCRWGIIYCSRACESKGWTSSHSWLCRLPELGQKDSQDVVFALIGYITSRSKGSEILPDIISNLDLHSEPLVKENESKLRLLSSLFYLSDHALKSLSTILAQIRCNVFAVKQAESVPVNSSLVVSRESVQLGQAVYLVASKFNHSCDPNTVITFSGENPCQLQVQCTKGKLVANQETTISYGPLASKHRLEERQAKLKNHYFFDCNCSSCCAASEDSPNHIYKCQICKTGKLYRQQSKCNQCGQAPHWAYYLKAEVESERHFEHGNYLEALQLREGIYHDNAIVLGETYDRLAQSYCVNGQMKLAAKYSHKSLLVTQKVFGAISIEAAEEMMKLSTLLFNSQQKGSALKQINATMILYTILGLDKSAPEDIEELEDLKNYLMFMP